MDSGKVDNKNSIQNMINTLSQLELEAKKYGIQNKWVTNGKFINDSTGLYLIAEFRGSLGPAVIADMRNIASELILALNKLNMIEAENANLKEELKAKEETHDNLWANRNRFRDENVKLREVVEAVRDCGEHIHPLIKSALAKLGNE